MPTSDAEVDRLYQLPLDEFTAERNALAKRRGSAGAAIRALQKPTLAAWAVNQLYWHKRKVVDRLIAASERLRRAHRTRLTGQGTDVTAEERAHQAALQAALDEVASLLTARGHAATADTLLAVADTLRALPVDAPIGRLTEPLRSTGFGLVASLLQGGPKIATPKADVLTFARPAAAREPLRPKSRSRDDGGDDREARARERAAAKAQAALHRKAVAEAKRELRSADRAARDAEAAAARARHDLEAVQRERERLEQALDEATRTRDGLRSEVTRTTKAAAEADLVRRQAAERARRLDEASATIGARGSRRDSNA